MINIRPNTVNLYTQRKRWKWLLIILGAMIVIISLWYTNIMVKNIASEERKKVKLWAEAIRRKAVLVNYTNNLFDKLKIQERKRVELWADANKYIFNAGPNEDLTFFVKIITDNTTIPVIVTNEKQEITNVANITIDLTKNKLFSDSLRQQFSSYPPFVIKYYGNHKLFLYYKDSKIFSELKDVMNDIIKSFLSEIINSASVPVIITDSTQNNVIASGNVDTLLLKNKTAVVNTISSFRSQNTPVEVELANHVKSYIFYKDSYLLTRLRYFPYIQFAIIGFFLMIAYFMLSTTRKAEQNQVWMGMAKETAHQLGTPLSSLMAWLEVLKMKHVDDEITNELQKDIERLETIAERFSKIGSPPKLEKVNIVKIIYQSVEYLKSRTSKNVKYIIQIPEFAEIMVPLNVRLFEWVIENICKNAVDAMSGNGILTIQLVEENNHICIDITNTGKAIPKSKFKTIFHPGYTTKSSGWGLGLSLVKRIIEEVHKGKIIVKKSLADKETTFRITLKKNS